jgi:hypothetical protein
MTVYRSGPGGASFVEAVAKSRVKADPKRADRMKRRFADHLDILQG